MFINYFVETVFHENKLPHWSYLQAKAICLHIWDLSGISNYYKSKRGSLVNIKRQSALIHEGGWIAMRLETTVKVALNPIFLYCTQTIQKAIKKSFETTLYCR